MDQVAIYGDKPQKVQRKRVSDEEIERRKQQYRDYKGEP